MKIWMRKKDDIDGGNIKTPEKLMHGLKGKLELLIQKPVLTFYMS